MICCWLIVLTACGRTPDRAEPATTASGPSRPVVEHVGLPQGAYVWQRIWTPAHRGALANSHELFSELHVLAAQLQPGEGWFDAHVDLDALRIDARNVRPVIRLDGGLPTLNANDIATRSARLIADWRNAGVHVDGIEIDFDGTAARMDEYARLLVVLKAQLPRDATISITVLPGWIAAPGLPALLDHADESALQLHATTDASSAPFDARQAAQSIADFGALARNPFDIALPSYGSALDATNGDDVQGGERRELNADPVAIAGLLRDLERAHPAKFHRVLWFRLPLPGDRRAWPLATLAAVIRDQPLQAKLEADATAGGDGAFDLQVANRGTLAAALPSQVEIDAPGCSNAEALPGYMAEQSGASWRLVRETSAALPASQTRALGRIHCPHLAASNLHVRP